MNIPKDSLMSELFNKPALCAATGLFILALAAGCGGNQADDAASNAAEEPAAKPTADSGWKPVVAQETAAPTDGEATSALTANDEEAAVSASDMAAKAQADAEALKARMEKTLRTDAANLEAQRKAAESQAAGATAAAPTAPTDAQTVANTSEEAAPPASVIRPTPPAEIIENMKKGQALQQEMQTIAGQLQDAHMKALKVPDIAEKQANLEAAALKAMKEISPDIEPEWLKLKALIQELETSAELAANDPSKISPETNAKFQEMQSLSQKLQPLQLKVSDQPEIKQLRDVFASAVDAEVAKLEPKAESLKARHAAILEELPKLQQEFMELQQKYMPAPPVPSAPAATAAPVEQAK